jgi:hypothetical protein
MNLNECYQSLGLKTFATIENVNMAYKRLVTKWQHDKLRAVAERRTKEINIARDWLVAHLKGLIKVNGQQVETIRLSVNYGQVSTFVSECCIYNSSCATERFDLYIDYRDWCFQSHFCPVSIEDFERSLTELGFATIIEKSGTAETVFWKGIEPSGYWYFINDPYNFCSNCSSDTDLESVKPKEYANMDDADDLSEVIF